MSVEEPKRTLAYICPACRQSVIVERDLFSLAAATAHIKCPCGRSELRVEFVDDHVDLEVPCLFCDREHRVSCSTHAFLHQKALAFSLRGLRPGLLLRGGGGPCLCRYGPAGAGGR